MMADPYEIVALQNRLYAQRDAIERAIGVAAFARLSYLLGLATSSALLVQAGVRYSLAGKQLKAGEHHELCSHDTRRGCTCGAKPSALDTAGAAIPMPSGPAAVSSPDGLAWRKVECWQATVGTVERDRWLSFSVELLNDGQKALIGLRARYRAAATEARDGVWFGTTEFPPVDTWAEAQTQCASFAAEWLRVNQSAAVEADSGKAIGVEAGPDVGSGR